MESKRTIVYDFETNGFWSPLNQPIQVCCKVIEPDLKEWTYTKYISCPIPLNPTITLLTGITNDILRKEGISLRECFTELYEIFKGDILVIGHNILRFDNNFLNHYMKTLGFNLSVIPNDCFDTYGAFKAILLGKSKPLDKTLGEFHNSVISMKSNGLGCKLHNAGDYFKIPYDTLHNAEKDVDLNYKVYLAIVEQVKLKNQS